LWWWLFQSYGAREEEEEGDQGSISPTFYEQLLRVQIPKTQKDTDDLTVFFSLLGSALVRTAHKMLVKSTPGNDGGEQREARS